MAVDAVSTEPLWKRSSFRLSVLSLGLTLFGTVMVASAAGSREFATVALRRLGMAAAGVLAFLIGANVDYQWWRRHHLGLLGATLALLALLLVPGVASARNGARRWISFGLPVGFQPSEFAKPAVCVWLAAYCERHLRRMGAPATGFLVPICVVGLVCALILLEPDFGTAVLLGVVGAVVLWVMGTRTLYFLLGAAACLPLAQKLVFEVPYRMERVLSFLNPWADPRGSGYQLIQSKIAIGSGGIFGLGLGMGRQEEGFLPLAENDFIFSIVAEELGLIGSVVVIAAFLLLLWEGFRLARRSRGPFAFALSLGLTAWIGLQSALHVAVVTGAVPTKGISLPFVSAGGSCLVTSMLAAGILVNIAHSVEEPEDHELRPWSEDVPEYERLAARAVGTLAAAVPRSPEPVETENSA